MTCIGIGKKILLLSGWYYPDSVGGTEVYVRNLGKELQNLGWQVFVAAPSVDEKEESYVHDGLQVYRYPISKNPSIDEIRGLTPPQYIEFFENWIKQIKPDLAHLHSRTRGCGFYHALLLKQLGIPLFLTIHSADFMCVAGTARLWGVSPCDGRINEQRCVACLFKRRGVPLWWLAWLCSRLPQALIDKLGLNLLKGKLGTLFSMKKIFLQRYEREKVLLSLFERIVIVSKWLYNVVKINEVPEERLYYCRHGLTSVMPVRRNANKDHDTVKVGFVGRFNHVKGIHILIKAVKGLPRHVNIQLKIYGRANLEEEKVYLERLMRMSKLDSRIEFCGELTEKNYVQVMSGFDLIAVPSIWLETGPYIVLEAFQAGIPVVGSKLGGIAELVTHKVNGLLIKPDSVGEWSKALQWIYHNQGVLDSFASRIPAVRSGKEVAEEMNSLYLSALAPKNT